MSVKTSGGGDECEDVIGALAKASELTFSFANKVLLFCGDAPCHGARFHDGCGDSYPDGEFEGSRESSEVINVLQQKGIDVTFLKVNDTTDKMIRAFNEDAGCEWITTGGLDVSDMEAIKATVRSSILESTERSFTASKMKLDSMGEYRRRRACRNTISRLERLVEMPSIPMASTPVALPIALPFAGEKSKEERLQELKYFFDKGLITKEEFSAQKMAVLCEP